VRPRLRGPPAAAKLPPTMRPLTTDQLARIIEQIAACDDDDRDDLLTDFLVVVYPSKSTQVN
jgi:hypothetical protein